MAAFAQVRRSMACVSFALYAASTFVPCRAYAQSAGNQAAAEALFDEAKALMAAKNYAVACKKFFESNRLDEGLGTSLWLADCYEKNGQTASAWAEFREAAALAVRANDPREKVARRHASALEPALAKLVIEVPSAARLPGLHVARDGGEVAAVLWGSALPVDPGRHTVVVSAPDHRPQTLSLEVRPGPGQQVVHVPVLAEAPPEPAPTVQEPGTSSTPAAVSEASSSRMPTQRIVAIGVGAAGVVGAVLATYFGFQAKSDLDDSNGPGHCTTSNVCNALGVADRSSAQSAATVSTVLFAVGGAAIAGSVVLWLTAPSHAASGHPSASLAPWVDPRSRGAGGVVLGADF